MSNILRFKWHSKFSAINFEVNLGHFPPTKIPSFVDCRPDIQTQEKLDPCNNKNRASLVAQLVNNPPAMPKTCVWSLGWEDILEMGQATHSSILAWRIPQTVNSMGLQRVGHDWATFTFTNSENPPSLSRSGQRNLYLTRGLPATYLNFFVFIFTFETKKYKPTIKASFI